MTFDLTSAWQLIKVLRNMSSSQDENIGKPIEKRKAGQQVILFKANAFHFDLESGFIKKNHSINLHGLYSGNQPVFWEEIKII